MERTIVSRFHSRQLELRGPGEPGETVWAQIWLLSQLRGEGTEVFILPLPSVLSHGSQSSCHLQESPQAES